MHERFHILSAFILFFCLWNVFLQSKLCSGFLRNNTEQMFLSFILLGLIKNLVRPVKPVVTNSIIFFASYLASESFYPFT